MKILGLTVTSLACAAIACVVLVASMQNHPVQAQQTVVAPERPLVFVPGLLGSRLCRPGPEGEETLVWGTSDALGQFPTLAVTQARSDIVPCGLIREISFLGIFSQAMYGPFIDRLERKGYREGENLFVFDYDWRLSVFDNAKLLANFIDEAVPGTSSIDIVGHSMGGLIARTYAINEGGAPRIAHLISAGSPWRGSVQVLDLLQNGWGLATSFMGGLDSFRRTAISFPSLFELMPHYDGCCSTEESGSTAFDAASVDAWIGLHWAGIDKNAVPDLVDARVRQERLRTIIGPSLPDNIEEALVIGVDQRTPERYDLVPSGDGEAHLNFRTSWEGDGTVMRDSALLSGRVIYSTSFATHDAILNDSSVQDFVLAALANGPDAAIKMVPVRERTSILTALGDLAELVGVAIATDQPAYLTGAKVTATVHLRLDVEDPVDVAALRMTVAPSGGIPTTVPLTPDPAASDPSIPLEQSFSTSFEVGRDAGYLTLTVTLNDTVGEPRTVTRIVPILTR
jgi:pimeloyl-ACP methyl ester carboxylesterase